MDTGHYWELRLCWPVSKALSFPTICFLSHMSILPSLWAIPSAPKWRGTSAGNACSISPTAATLQAGDTLGTGVGHGPTGSARCSKSCWIIKQLPPQEAFQALSFRITWMWIFHFITLSPKALNAISQPPVLLFHHLNEVTHSLLFQILLFPLRVSTSQPPRLCILWTQTCLSSRALITSYVSILILHQGSAVSQNQGSKKKLIQIP